MKAVNDAEVNVGLIDSARWAGSWMLEGPLREVGFGVLLPRLVGVGPVGLRVLIESAEGLDDDREPNKDSVVGRPGSERLRRGFEMG